MNIFLHALRCLRAVFRMCRERGAFGDPSANVQNPRGDGQREDGRGDTPAERGGCAAKTGARSGEAVGRNQPPDRENSRRAGATCTFPANYVVKTSQYKIDSAEIYPCGEAVRFYPVQTGFRILPAAGQAESQNEAKNGTHGHPVKQAPCGRGKPNTVRNGVRHARCVV